MRNPFDITPYRFDISTLIDELLDKKKEKHLYIVTPNINHICQLNESSTLRDAYRAAAYHVCDSKILSPIFKVLTGTTPPVIPGSTLTAELFKLTNTIELSFCVIGSNKQDIEAIKSTYPNATVHHHSPPMGFINSPEEVNKCINYIISKKADFTIYAVGCPRQEILAMRVTESSKACGIGLCVGASIDFLSGRTKRAPIWVQRIRMEWAFRILSEPKRLAKRYLHDALALPRILYSEYSIMRQSQKTEK
ncbi:WecB/TagA/CpsF family glycosyltransferase [Pseudomonas sp. QL9]|uniref:WecB/TagA/CpsF family glycosyltransferase n=1 Tax=Pseudomonas sp. QL9 TaxID=3242725 RepID=UPI00352A8783